MFRRSLDERQGPRLRVDPSRAGPGGFRGRGVPGRRFVLAGVAGLLVAWGVLYLIFSIWRSGVEQRIALGMALVPPVVVELAELEPPGVDRDDWREAVAETEAMLAEVVGTGRVDRPRLEALHADLERRVAEARRDPASAPGIVAGIWDDMARLKRFRSGTDRPPVLGPARGAGRSPGGQGGGTGR